MKKLSFLPLLLLCLQTFSQQDDASRYAAGITITALQKHLTIIAGGDMQGRETGTEGQRKAAAYIESQFKTMGIQPAPVLNGYQQFYPLYQDSMLMSKLRIGKTEAVYGKDYISSPINNENGELKSKQVVFVGYGIEDTNYNDYSGLDVKGKTVILFLGEPKEDGKYLVTGTTRSSEWTFPGLSKKLDLAAKKGAVAVLLVNPNQASFNLRTVDNSRKTSLYFPRTATEKKLNYVVLSHEFAKKIFLPDADSLVAIAKNGRSFLGTPHFEKRVKIKFDFKKSRNTVNASNVLGLIEGSDKKDEYVFITAHYDHLGMRDGKIYYGADDDGSGTVGIMQIGAAFALAKKEGKGPRRTVVVMAFSGEEKGLLGSEYYSDHPVFPLEKTTVNLNIDMVGRIDTERKLDDTMNYVYVVGHDKLSSDLPVINEGVNKQYSGLTLDYKFDDPKDPHRIYFRSDHYNFARKGVPVLFFYDGMLKSDYHKPTDTVDKITWPLYEKRVKMIFHTAWEIANRDAMLTRDIPLPVMTR